MRGYSQVSVSDMNSELVRIPCCLSHKMWDVLHAAALSHSWESSEWSNKI